MVNCDHYLCRSSATEDGDTEYDEVDQMRNMTKGTITVVLLVFAVAVDDLLSLPDRIVTSIRRLTRSAPVGNKVAR